MARHRETDAQLDLFAVAEAPRPAKVPVERVTARWTLPADYGTETDWTPVPLDPELDAWFEARERRWNRAEA